MITIDQLLESVDLDFEPRWVTKDKIGQVKLWLRKPKQSNKWAIWSLESSVSYEFESFGCLKLAEFDGKDWTECIYEVSRKTIGKIEKIHIPDMDEVAESAMYSKELAKRLNQVIDAVNELKAHMELPTLNPDLTDEDLRKMMRNPKYWRDKDSVTIQKVQNGFNKLYGDKN